jgi:hypothetical protein
MNDTQKTLLKTKMSQLAQRIIDKFGKVSSAFRAFDVRTRGAVTFSDFAYVIDQMKLKFERDLIMQIFTYMDSDRDNILKYRDFCNLCAEQVLQAPTGRDSAYMSTSNATGSTNFSKIIKELKSKHPGSKGRGGPNFVKRGQSAGQK